MVILSTPIEEETYVSYVYEPGPDESNIEIDAMLISKINNESKLSVDEYSIYTLSRQEGVEGGLEYMLDDELKCKPNN